MHMRTCDRQTNRPTDRSAMHNAASRGDIRVIIPAFISDNASGTPWY